MDIVAKDLGNFTNVRTFTDGSERSFEILRTSSMGIGTYKPGWKWSVHAGTQTGKAAENHIGYIISGSFIVKGVRGEEQRVGPGHAFELSPGHDAWVYGNEPCIALDFRCNQQHDCNNHE